MSKALDQSLDAVPLRLQPVREVALELFEGLKISGGLVVSQRFANSLPNVVKLMISDLVVLSQLQCQRLHHVVRADSERVRVFGQNTPFRACLSAAYQTDQGESEPTPPVPPREAEVEEVTP